MADPLFLLASASPRRKLLLEALGLPFAVVPNPWEEVNHPYERPAAQAHRLAREKLVHFLETHPGTTVPVLTADTLLSFRGRAVNKPDTADQAWEFYRELAGHRHRVLTSFAVSDPKTARIRQRTVTTTVEFVPWDEALYRRYLERGEWRDAAGGYKIQDTGTVLVRGISGSLSNVVGLPIAEVYAILLATLRVPRG